MRWVLVLALVILAVSSRGGRWGYVVRSRHKAYRAIKGLSKSARAAIANKGRTFAGRSAMAKKAARTRKRRGR
jgi:hypothetical protein